MNPNLDSDSNADSRFVVPITPCLPAFWSLVCPAAFESDLKQWDPDSDSAGFGFEVPGFGSGFRFEVPGFAHH